MSQLTVPFLLSLLIVSIFGRSTDIIYAAWPSFSPSSSWLWYIWQSQLMLRRMAPNRSLPVIILRCQLLSSFHVTICDLIIWYATIFLPKVRWRMQARWVAMHASRMKGVQVEVKQLDDMEKAGILGCIVKIVEHDLHKIMKSVQSCSKTFANHSEDCNMLN